MRAQRIIILPARVLPAWVLRVWVLSILFLPVFVSPLFVTPLQAMQSAFLPAESNAVSPAVSPSSPLNVTELVRQAVANHIARDLQAKNYACLERQKITAIDASGRANGQVMETFEIIWLEGAPYRRRIQRNGQPLPAEEEKLEEAKMERELLKRRGGGMAEGRPGKARSALGHVYLRSAQLHIPLRLLPDEFSLELAGEEILEGRRTFIVEATPKHGYKPSKDEDEKNALNFQIRIWIDQQDTQIAKAEGEVIKNGVAYRPEMIAMDSQNLTTRQVADLEAAIQHSTLVYQPGTFIYAAWIKINDEAWVPGSSYVKGKKEILVNAPSSLAIQQRIFPEEIETTYSDYKKFHAASRIVPE